MPSTPVVPLVTQVHPTLASLPVYVRGGAILPVAPLTQSTSETPIGPLTLRVFEGPDCRGSLYLDDGETYAFQHGHFLRMQFTCNTASDGMHVTLSPHEGDYPAWWRNVRLEIHKQGQLSGIATRSGSPAANPARIEGNAVVVEVPDDGKGQTLVVR